MSQLGEQRGLEVLARRSFMSIRSCRTGFTLIEQLLVIALVALLLGSIIYNFSASYRGAALDEGAMQMESLFRFARAHAASTGKIVHVLFPEAGFGDNAELLRAETPDATVRVMWESDPIGAPGAFQDLPAAVSYIESVSELVTIQRAQDTEALPNEISLIPTLVAFYPDGSSDSVEITLASRSENDSRHFIVQVIGLTGLVRSRLLDAVALESKQK